MAEVAASDSSILSGQACVEYRGKCQDGQSLWLIDDVQHISTDGKPHSSFVHDACAPQERFTPAISMSASPAKNASVA